MNPGDIKANPDCHVTLALSASADDGLTRETPLGAAAMDDHVFDM